MIIVAINHYIYDFKGKSTFDIQNAFIRDFLYKIKIWYKQNIWGTKLENLLPSDHYVHW